MRSAGIKLSTVATDILGASGRSMLAALIDGERDVHALAQCRRRPECVPKIRQELVEALTGTFGQHHACLCRLHMARIDELSAARSRSLSSRVEKQMRPFPPA